jgi:S1-C subfamily serine protease
MSCIHCHQIRDADRREARESGQALSDELLYPYPMPDVLGIKLDPKELATIKAVAEGSAAAKAGLKAGDKLVSLNGQPPISVADVQWVLHNVKTPSDLAVQVERGGKTLDVKILLKEGWRRADDITWRTTTWELRRMAAGGIKFDVLPEADRAKLKIASDALALRIAHLGGYGEHAAAKKAGFQQGDILVKYDGSTAPLKEQELLVLGMTKHKRGDQVPVTVLRGEKEVELKLPLQ